MYLLVYTERKARLNKKGREWKTAVKSSDGEVVWEYMGFGKAADEAWHGYSKVNVVMNRPGNTGVLWNQNGAATAAREGVGFPAVGESDFSLVRRLVMVRQTLLSPSGELQLTRFQKLTCFSLVHASAGF